MAKRATFLSIALLALFFSGAACAQDDPACAKYEEPLAYNACLARQGPKANDVGIAQGHGSHRGVFPIHEHARSGSGLISTQNWPVGTRRRGRVHVEFSVQ